MDKKYFKTSKNSEKYKIMICGIHYFITKLKTKIYVIPRNRFNVRATFTSKFKESERDKHTASSIREVLQRHTSMLFKDALSTILFFCVAIYALITTMSYNLISESFAYCLCDMCFCIYDAFCTFSTSISIYIYFLLGQRV